jgi:2-polyprenyl-6-methoxyphenol hydroxylase-like FAD-dependent oxidoreductase
MQPANDVDLLVIGAGPVGLFAGLSAARRGLRVQILDQNFRGCAPGRVALLHARSLELLSELGLGDEVRRMGRRLDRVTVHVGGERAACLELPKPALSIAQSALEELLLSALRRDEVELRAPFRAQTVEQNTSAVRVGVVRREPLSAAVGEECPAIWEPVESSTVSADFVIGADGYDSRVRPSLGIEVIDVGGLQTFTMFELSNTANPHLDELQLAFAEDLGSAFMPLPHGRMRCGFQIASGLNEVPNVELLRQLLLERAPWLNGDIEAIDWAVVTHFERRLARRLGFGRIWLAGDAAHVTSPFGGQSMNVGLLEAHEFVQRMADCVLVGKPLEALEYHATERLREWLKLLGINVQYELLPHAPSWLGSYAQQLLPILPASGQDLELLLKQVGVSIR